MTWSGKRGARLVLLIAVITAMLTSLLPSHPASAAQLTSRSLTLQAGATDGGSKPSGVVNHLFAFTIATSGNVGSIKFQYCTTAAGTCTTPAGLSTTSATLGTSSGATFTSLNTSTNGSPYLSRTAANINASTAVSYQLLGVTNPDNTNCFSGTTPQSNNCPFYVRITTYASTDTTGGVTDAGTVAASTATQITLTGTMPESLIFCTGETITTTNGIPDCSTATTGAISFDRLFSPADTATAKSQMAASTNGVSGYNITVNGSTLTSGSAQINPLASPSTTTRGLSQFGMNLVANSTAVSTPAVGSAVAPAANGTNFKGQALSGYNTADTFKFLTGDSIANSANGGAGPTDSQIYTVSYVVNVSGGQLAGTYTTTLTYICTSTF